MADMTARDGYWAAKILSAFTDEDLRLIVEQGHFQNPAAVDFLVETLAARRDKIVRYWFAKVPPIDFFTLTPAGIEFHDLAVERGYTEVEKPLYRFRLKPVDSQRKEGADGWTDWQEITTTVVPLFDETNRLSADIPRGGEEYPFLAIDVQVDHGDGWSSSTVLYGAYATGRLVALDR